MDYSQLGDFLSYYIFILAISLWIGFTCVDWAKQIKANKVIAFFVGFVFGLFGLIGYRIYYNKQIKKQKENEN